ncbi:MAG: glutamate-cysteine ligase family protein [Gemmatimonadota bacterium]|jgi:glutamate---cysteine ligase / carboxylate-amine ligase
MRPPLRLFQAFGVEIEFMVVDRETLDVRPVVDRLIHGIAGQYASEVELGGLALSNELTLHVAELKTNGPAPRLQGLADLFQDQVRTLDGRLADLDARLMPGGMHPWMDPHTEMRLWPHDYNAVYEKFDQIFDCTGHGWANLQSTHINLPFRGNNELGRLHGAIRLVLPLIPALAASSPIRNARVGPDLDNRLRAYQGNARRVPSVSGLVVPEAVFTRRDYEEQILHRIYRDLEPYDPDGILRYEWANARGAIVRFDRSAIEIRLVDAQECPRADLAVTAAIVAAVRALALADPPPGSTRPPATEALAAILDATIGMGERAVIEDDAYLAMLGLAAPASAGDVWRHLVDTHLRPDPDAAEWLPALDVILEQGPLARRILRVMDAEPGQSVDPARLREVYRNLCDCLLAGTILSVE